MAALIVSAPSSSALNSGRSVPRYCPKARWMSATIASASSARAGQIRRGLPSAACFRTLRVLPSPGGHPAVFRTCRPAPQSPPRTRPHPARGVLRQPDHDVCADRVRCRQQPRNSGVPALALHDAGARRAAAGAGARPGAAAPHDPPHPWPWPLHLHDVVRLSVFGGLYQRQPRRPGALHLPADGRHRLASAGPRAHDLAEGAVPDRGIRGTRSSPRRTDSGRSTGAASPLVLPPRSVWFASPCSEPARCPGRILSP